LHDRLRAAVGDKSAAKNVTLGVIRKGTETAIAMPTRTDWTTGYLCKNALNG
jgi:hypothetical protein